MPHRSRLEGRAPRLAGVAYHTPGLYFVTLCLHERLPLLGTVVDGTMCLSEAGGDVLSVWSDLPGRYPHVVPDVCVVMPDHVHSVIGLRTGDTTGRHGLSEVVRNWKTYSAQRINARRFTPGARVWKRSFYDHIVRGGRDLERIRRYIEENPARWTARFGSGNGPWGSDGAPASPRPQW